MPREPAKERAWWRKLAWLIAIWAASVLALGAVAWLMRVVMRAVGMSP